MVTMNVALAYNVGGTSVAVTEHTSAALLLVNQPSPFVHVYNFADLKRVIRELRDEITAQIVKIKVFPACAFGNPDEA